MGDTKSNATTVDGYSEASTTTLLLPNPKPTVKPPQDTFHLAYIIYFTVGFGNLIPWNAFITAVDYFSYLYPDAAVDRVFSVVYMVVGFVSLFFIVGFSHKSHSFGRINVGLGMFVVALLVVPVMDMTYVKGTVGVYGGFYVTVVTVGLSGIADALVQGGLIGAAGEMPERYVQAVVAGTAGTCSLCPSGRGSIFVIEIWAA